MALAAVLLTTLPPAQAGLLEPVSVPDSAFPPSTTAGGESVAPIISADGRFVLFSSTAENLVIMADGRPLPPNAPARLNVFCRDRSNSTTRLISVSADGLSGGDGDSMPVAISTNGQFVLFASTAGNLVADDTNGLSDIFLRDMTGGVTELVSVNPQGTSGNGASRGAVMTPDGRHIAFASTATNLVAGDTNRIEDVFVRDRMAGLTVLASANAASTNSGEYLNSSEAPQITPDGRYVAFFSTMTNLSPAVRPVGEVFVRDLLTQTTVRASRHANSLIQSSPLPNKTISCGHQISDAGRYVAFAAHTNTASTLTRSGLILRHDLLTEVTEVVHTNANIPLSNSADLGNLDLTPDGRFIAFIANTNATGFTGDDATCILRWDAQSSSLTLVSGNLSNTVPARTMCDTPVISPDGDQVCFLSNVTNLTTNVLSGEFHFYHHDFPAGTTALVDVSTHGSGAGVDFTSVPQMSAAGNLVAFASAAPDIVGDDRNRGRDVFVRDLISASAELVSVRHPSLPSETAHGVSGLHLFSMSTNSRYIAFASDADDLAANDTNGLRDVFVRDMWLGSSVLVSVATNGLAAHGFPSDPVISGDGRYVAFSSMASNLVAADGNQAQDIFVRDLLAGTTTLASVTTVTNSFYNGRDSFGPQLGEDGRYLLFRSYAAYLTTNPLASGSENLYVRDLLIGTNYALTTATGAAGVTAASMTPDGQFVAFAGQGVNFSPRLYVWDTQSRTRVYTNSAGAFGVAVSISPNGARIAYLPSLLGPLYVADRLLNTNWLVTTGKFWSSAAAGLRFSADGRYLVYATLATHSPSDTNTTQDVYLYDCLGGTNLLVSRSYASAQAATGHSDSPTLSPDGRFIAFRSAADDLVPDDHNGVPDLFLFDRVNRSMILVSVNRTGDATANRRSLSPVFSADSASLAFRTWASDLVGGDFNQLSDLSLLRLTSPPITDSDADGMEDQWELDYFMTLARDGTDDLDLDGALDALEFKTGTNPTNALSLFRAELEMVEAPAPLPLVSWPAKPSGAYRVQFKDDPGDSEWQNLESPVTLFGRTGVASDTSPHPPHRYYRVVLVE